MTRILKTVTVPANHQLHLDIDLPSDIPEGEVELLMIISAIPPEASRAKLLRLGGCLASSRTFSGDPVALQRMMRHDWS